MGNIRSGLLAAAVGIAVLAPHAASANVIAETYTMAQFPAISADGLILFRICRWRSSTPQTAR